MTSVVPEFSGAQPPGLPAVPLDVDLFIEEMQFRATQGMAGESSEADEVRAAMQIGHELIDLYGNHSADTTNAKIFSLGTANLIWQDILTHVETVFDDHTTLPEGERRHRSINSRTYADVLRIGHAMLQWEKFNLSQEIRLSPAQEICWNVVTLACRADWSEDSWLTAVAALDKEAGVQAPEEESPSVPIEVEWYIEGVLQRIELAIENSEHPEAEEIRRQLLYASDEIEAEGEAFWGDAGAPSSEEEQRHRKDTAAILNCLSNMITADIMKLYREREQNPTTISPAERVMGYNQSLLFAGLLETGQEMIAWAESHENTQFNEFETICGEVAYLAMQVWGNEEDLTDAINDLRQHARILAVAPPEK